MNMLHAWLLILLFTCFVFLSVNVQVLECDHSDMLRNRSTCLRSTLTVMWMVCQCCAVEAIPNRLLNKMFIQPLFLLSLLSVVEWGTEQLLSQSWGKAAWCPTGVIVTASFCLYMLSMYVYCVGPPAFAEPAVCVSLIVYGDHVALQVPHGQVNQCNQEHLASLPGVFKNWAAAE